MLIIEKIRNYRQIFSGAVFGLTSTSIITIGLMMGLETVTGLKSVVIAGLLSIAVADALADATAMHLSKESENRHASQEIQGAVIGAFLGKFFPALIFTVPVILLPLFLAIWINVTLALILVGLTSWLMARSVGESAWKTILEHDLIVIIVAILTHYIGKLISTTCGMACN